MSEKLFDFYFSIIGLNKRCMRCRSRGELGSCGDPFPFNVTDPEAEVGVHVIACPSGWCGKLNQGSTGTFRSDGTVSINLYNYITFLV